MDIGFHLRGHRVYVPSVSPKAALVRGTPPSIPGIVRLERERRQMSFAGEGVTLPPIPPLFQRYLLYEPVDGGKITHSSTFTQVARINYPVVRQGEYEWGIRLFAAFAEIQDLREKGWCFAIDIRTPAISMQEMSDFLWSMIPMIRGMDKGERFKVSLLFSGKILITQGTEDLEGGIKEDSRTIIDSTHDGRFPVAQDTDNKVGALVYQRPSGEWVTYYDGLREVQEPDGELSGWYLIGLDAKGGIQAISPIAPCPIPQGVHVEPKYIVCLDSTFVTGADQEIYNQIIESINSTQREMRTL